MLVPQRWRDIVGFGAVDDHDCSAAGGVMLGAGGLIIAKDCYTTAL
jgi:hypothetical protein